MNLGLVLSYIVAGVITMALLTMNMGVQRSNAELTFLTMKKNHMSAVAEMIEFDLAKVAYDINGPITDAIKVADSTRFRFEADINNDGDTDMITWDLTTDDVPNTTNPDDRMLRRTVIWDSDDILNWVLNTETTDIPLGVVDFDLNYYSNTGSLVPLSTPVTGAALNNISQIQVSVSMQSGDEVYPNNSGPGRYIQTHFDKIYSPVNLNQ